MAERPFQPNLLDKFTISGGNDEGVPPVPIPNTEVKPFSADGTWLETARESRSLPESNSRSLQELLFFYVGGRNAGDRAWLGDGTAGSF